MSIRQAKHREKNRRDEITRNAIIKIPQIISVLSDVHKRQIRALAKTDCAYYINQQLEKVVLDLYVWLRGEWEKNIYLLDWKYILDLNPDLVEKGYEIYKRTFLKQMKQYGMQE